MQYGSDAEASARVVPDKKVPGKTLKDPARHDQWQWLVDVDWHHKRPSHGWFGRGDGSIGCVDGYDLRARGNRRVEGHIVSSASAHHRTDCGDRDQHPQCLAQSAPASYAEGKNTEGQEREYSPGSGCVKHTRGIEAERQGRRSRHFNDNRHRFRG